MCDRVLDPVRYGDGRYRWILEKFFGVPVATARILQHLFPSNASGIAACLEALASPSASRASSGSAGREQARSGATGFAPTL